MKFNPSTKYLFVANKHIPILSIASTFTTISINTITMKSTNRFKIAFNRLLKESMTAGAGGAFGDPDAIFDPDNAQYKSGDYYAPGDTRMPHALGGVQTRDGEIKKRKRKKKKTDNKND
jgi:hypothetical protein